MVARAGPGSFAVRIPEPERRALTRFLGELRAVLEDGDPSDPALRHLHPEAYPDDPERSAEFHRLVRDDLTAQRLAAVAAMERTVGADRLSEEELVGWLGAVNDLRLVLGTRLEVTAETSLDDFPRQDPGAARFAAYAYLSYLEEEILEALDGAPGRESD